MKIRPIHDRIVVTRNEAEGKSAGGLFIPDSAKEKPAQGIVVAVGEGKFDERGNRCPMDVKAGDRILFGKYAGTELKLNGEDFVMLSEHEVLAVLAPSG